MVLCSRDGSLIGEATNYNTPVRHSMSGLPRPSLRSPEFIAVDQHMTHRYWRGMVVSKPVHDTHSDPSLFELAILDRSMCEPLHQAIPKPMQHDGL